jgi:hypothetical protein
MNTRSWEFIGNLSEGQEFVVTFPIVKRLFESSYAKWRLGNDLHVLRMKVDLFVSNRLPRNFTGGYLESKGCELFA